MNHSAISSKIRSVCACVCVCVCEVLGKPGTGGVLYQPYREGKDSFSCGFTVTKHPEELEAASARPVNCSFFSDNTQGS